MPPPKYIPTPDLSLRWAADPFDKRMRVSGPRGHLVHTPVGCIVEVVAWIKEHHKETDPIFQPALTTLIETLKLFAPDALDEVTRKSVD